MQLGSNKVVVTGIGLVTPLGNDPETVWQHLQNQQSGIARIDWIPIDHLPSDLFGAARFTGARADYGAIDDRLWRQILKARKLMSREVELGVAAAQRAILDAQLKPTSGDPLRKGCVFASDYSVVSPLEFSSSFQRSRETGHIDLGDWGRRGFRKIDPLWTLKYAPNMPPGHTAILNQLQGPANAITMREASSNLALHSASMSIKKGLADVMVVGATGSRIHSLMTVNSQNSERLVPRHADPAQACRPFHPSSQGSIIGEGAAAVVLESEAHALRRGIPILAEYAGFGSATCVTPTSTGGLRQAIEFAIDRCLDHSQLLCSAVGHFHAHGLGDTVLDQQEAEAVVRRLGDVPVIASKGLTGNVGAACGLIESIQSILALKRGELFPISPWVEDRGYWPGLNLIGRDSKSVSSGSSFLNLNYSPAGQANVVAFRKFSPGNIP